MFAEERPTLRALPVEPFRYYRYGTALSTSTAVDRSRLLPCAARLDRPRGRHPVGRPPSRLLDPATGSCSVNTGPAPGRYAPPADQPSRTPPTTQALWPGRPEPAPGSARCARQSTVATAPGVRRILGVGPRQASTAPPSSTRPVPLPWSAGHHLPLRPPLPRTAPAAPLTLRQVDPLIRELTHYRAVIAQKTQEVPT
jgi:hypothetical protein